VIALASLLIAGVTVVLPMEAKVQGAELALGDIAQVVGADAAEVNAVRGVALGYAPAPGYSRLVFAHRVAESVRRDAPGIEVSFSGQRACRVWPEVRQVSGSEVVSAAGLEMRRRIGVADATFEPAGSVASISIPAGDEPFRLRARSGVFEPRSGQVSIPVEILVNGTVYRTAWTSWKVEVWQVRPVVARAVRAGEILASSMFANRRVRVEAGAAARALSAGLLTGSIAARDFRPGEIVTEKDVHRPIVVQPGDSIYVEVCKGRIKARVAAIALSAGAIGDRIPVRTVGEGKALSGSIVGRNLVRVDLGASSRTAGNAQNLQK